MPTLVTRVYAAAILLFAIAITAPAAYAQQHAFNVPAAEATSALPELARQAGVQIVAPGRDLRGVRTPAIKGQMDTHTALRKLLSGTHLHVASDDGRTITLSADASQSGAEPAAAGKRQPSALPGDPPPAVDTDTGSGGDQPQLDSRNIKKLSGVTVTGTYIRNIDVQTALPVTTITQQDIALSGASTVSDLLSQLPQSAAFDNNETSTGPNDARGDAASINLRGLGSGNTLVLLNGRRIAPHPISAGAVPRLSTNINQIPLGAIERIEVLRDGASALYGSDAVAGVVNIILKKDFDGLDAHVRYGHVETGGLGETSATLLGGHNSDDGRTNVMGFLGLYRRTALQASDKSFTSTGDLRDRANSTSTRWDNRSLSGPYGNFVTGTANADGSFSYRDVTAIDGDTFHTAPGDNGVDIVPGSLPRSLRYDYTPDYTLLPKTRRYQFYGAVNHDFDNDIHAYADAFYYHAHSFIANAASPISANSDNDIYVPASNYYNPFGTRFYGPGTAHPDEQPSDVLIKNYRPVEIGLRTADVTSKAWQVSAGLRGLIGSWQWDVGADYGKGQTVDYGGNMMSESRLRAQLALDTPDAFNPFGGPGANTPTALDAVRITTWRKGSAGLGSINARASGDLFDIPGGSVQAAAGLQYRHESYSDRRDPFTLNDDVIALSQSADADGSRNVYAAFAELFVPIFSESNSIPGLHRLELSLAGRTEHYSDFGDATKPKVSLAWSPVDWLLLRGTYSEGFRAPTLAQVFTGQIVRRNTGTPDPYRVDVTGTPADLGDESRQVRRGGNPDLGPEQAKENSFGFVFQAPFARNLSISADYFRIRQQDVIDTYGEAQQLALDFQLRESGQGSNPNVVRLPVTDADRAAFAAWNAAHPDDQRAPAGTIDYVRDTFINIARREVSGVDFGLKYRLRQTRLGNFNFKVNIAYLDEFLQQLDASSPEQQQLEYNGLPRVRGVAGVEWNRHRYSAGLLARYISSFKDTSAPTDANGDYFRVKAWTVYNAYVGLKLGDPDARHASSLRLGINNVFDKDPPLADENRGYFETIHDPRGRFYYLDWHMRL